MTGEEALALVREAFDRRTWTRIDPMAGICRLHRVVDHRYLDRRRAVMPTDRGMLPDSGEPVFFDLSAVFCPADRIAFHAHEQPGAVIGHTAGLARVEL